MMTPAQPDRTAVPAALQRFFDAHPRVGLGLSGGVDSTYLLWAGLACGAEVVPYFVQSAFQPQFEQADALELTAALGVELRVIDLDVLAHEQVRANPADRCYFCKTEIFGTISRAAAADGLPLVIDGSNASDDAGDRPGMTALREIGVRSPLRLAGLTKPEIRELARQASLFTWDKPAHACLATRIPTGTTIRPEALARVEAAESALSELGFSDLRVRALGKVARLQVPADQLSRAVDLRDEIRARLAVGFDVVLLDLEPR